jgi:hypothetical protein
MISNAHLGVSVSVSEGVAVSVKREAPFALPDWIPDDAWQGYVEMRAKIKKPMTDRARDLIVAKLDRWRADGHSVGAVLDASTSNNWTDVYLPKTNPVKAQPKSSWADWLEGTPFTNRYEAENAGCYEHNAAKFRRQGLL